MDTSGMTEKVAIITSPGEGKGLDELDSVGFVSRKAKKKAKPC
jgi:hypothetical protein